ncbi:hypothetical protein [uncultured Psychroserpens sp.]|uniref:hypothetical protein n=1 Tax=uncultured Psychroserpens sp. TaxID=255436 RepID=UPI002621264F|nr:hypothetical protein [uncultured Psychroserpens sp.]
MSIQRKPRDIRSRVAAKSSQNPATLKGLTQINPVKMQFQAYNAKLFTQVHAVLIQPITNTLNSAPSGDGVYEYNRKKYGRPKFRFKLQTTEEKIPGEQALRFSEGDNEDIHLKIIIEAYRDEPNVIPLAYRELKIKFHYEHNGATKTIPLTITKTNPIQALNVSNHIYAHALIKADVKDAIYKAFTSPNILAKFEVLADVWWQKPPFTIRKARRAIDPRTRKPIHVAAKKVKNKDVKPRKVVVKTELFKHVEPNDPEVFGGIFSNLEIQDYKWTLANKASNNEDHSFYYRLTNDPNKVLFLPQVYRIAVDRLGQPMVDINLYKIKNETEAYVYRIKVIFHMIPYFHPKAKKDLMRELSDRFGGKIKYAQDLRLEGYKEVSFVIEDRFLDDDPLSGKFKKELINIDPVKGFAITGDFSLESFEVFKRELLRGAVNIGKIFFELQEKEEGEDIITKSKPINVELNLEKLQNIHLDTEMLISSNGQTSWPSGFKLINKTDIPLKLEGVELTLLSVDEEKKEVHHVDNDLKTTIREKNWPLIEPQQEVDINLDGTSVDSIPDKNMVWTALVCEPYGVRADINSEVIMNSVIDRASGDSEIWNLKVLCPPFKNWSTLSEDERLLYMNVISLLIETRLKDDPNNTFSIVLNKDQPEGVIKMSKTARQLLQSIDFDNRKYDYRINTVTTSSVNEGEWQEAGSMYTDFLYVFPPKP